MKNSLRPALALLLFFTVVTGLIYPLFTTFAAQAVFPAQANGSLIEKNGVVIGSSLIGQSFTSDGYFHGRLSATSGPDPKNPSASVPMPYNAANSAGSNLGPTSKALVERVAASAKELRASPLAPVPVDLVTTSASGLDPDITPAAAFYQVARVAHARGLSQAVVRDLVTQYTQGRTLGIFGEVRVNVLALNLALDNLKPQG